MATRACIDLTRATIRSYTVKAASAVTAFKAVKFNTSDETQALDCTAGDQADGYALETGAAGDVVQVATFISGGAAKALVGTGGCTVGDWLKVVSDGVTTITPGGGTTLRQVVGKALQTGVAGDHVAVELTHFATVSS